MSRPIVLYLILVCGPAIALAVFAFRSAEMDHENGKAAIRSDLEVRAEQALDRIDRSLEDAWSRAESIFDKVDEAVKARQSTPSESVIGFASEGRWIGYSPFTGAEDQPDPMIPVGELALFKRSIEGGESFELRRGDPVGAIDAYSFYLPKIRSEALRARLQFRLARASRTGRLPMAESFLHLILKDGDGGAFEDGLPVDFLAALMLWNSGSIPDQTRRYMLHEVLRKKESLLTTPLLEIVRKNYLSIDSWLQVKIQKRKEFEIDIERNPGILSDLNVALCGDSILCSRKILNGRVKAIVRLDHRINISSWLGYVFRISTESPECSMPSNRLSLGGIPVSRLVWGPQGSNRSSESRGGPLGILQVGHQGSEDALRALDRKRFLQKSLVLLLIASTLAGGIALVFFLRREREVARLRSRLLGNISHELRTPITSIRMLSELLAEKPGDAESTKRFADLLQAEGGRLGGLIENLLEYSRLGRKEVDLPREPVDLAALLDRTAAQFRLHTARESVDFRWERPEGLPAVLTHAPAVERIVLNLLENALKYRRKDGPWIRLAAIVDGRKVLLSVADNGLGIRPEDRERIFEEFYRVRYDDYAVPGSGLGLPIARRLARKLGGGIRLESRPGEGSTFTLELPLEEGPEAS